MSDEILKPQCPYVFDDGFCCDRGKGHDGEHTTNKNALRYTAKKQEPGDD